MFKKLINSKSENYKCLQFFKKSIDHSNRLDTIKKEKVNYKAYLKHLTRMYDNQKYGNIVGNAKKRCGVYN